jgi:rhodanese-related sulfurtransferase
MSETNKYTIVDVRTRGEFAGGNIAGSINIPLDEVADRSDEIMELEAPVLFCCLSGGRSGQATAYFQGKGLECENGGGWLEVNARFNS